MFSGEERRIGLVDRQHGGRVGAAACLQHFGILHQRRLDLGIGPGDLVAASLRGSFDAGGAQQQGFEPLGMGPVLGWDHHGGRIAGGLELVEAGQEFLPGLGRRHTAFSSCAVLYQMAERSP